VDLAGINASGQLHILGEVDGLGTGMDEEMNGRWGPYEEDGLSEATLGFAVEVALEGRVSEGNEWSVKWQSLVVHDPTICPAVQMGSSLLHACIVPHIELVGFHRVSILELIEASSRGMDGLGQREISWKS
jgi:hypothetical protein